MSSHHVSRLRVWPDEGVVVHPANRGGRDFVAGDIHGHFGTVEQALDALAFDPSQDRLFSVGDLVDRGPRSADALEWVRAGRIHAVRGNHELLLVNTLALEGGQLRKSGYAAQWFDNGGGGSGGSTESTTTDKRYGLTSTTISASAIGSTQCARCLTCAAWRPQAPPSESRTPSLTTTPTGPNARRRCAQARHANGTTRTRPPSSAHLLISSGAGPQSSARTATPATCPPRGRESGSSWWATLRAQCHDGSAATRCASTPASTSRSTATSRSRKSKPASRNCTSSLREDRNGCRRAKAGD